MKLATMKVADWSKLAGVARTPALPLAYDTGYEVAGEFPAEPYRGVLAFPHDGRIWLAVTAEAGGEPAPFLGMAWTVLFPRCEWLPEQFGDANSVEDYRRLLPPEDAASLVRRLRDSLQHELARSREGLAILDEGGDNGGSDR